MPQGDLGCKSGVAKMDKPQQLIKITKVPYV